MSIIFITGLSGSGKTSVLDTLYQLGYSTVEADNGYTIKQGNEYLLDEDKIEALIETYQDKHLFISGCCLNQAKFYKYFKTVVLFVAPLDVMKKRILNRDNNPYGKHQNEWQEILDNHQFVLPLLKKSSDIIIDTSLFTIDQLCQKLISLL